MKSKVAIVIDSVFISLICGLVGYSWCNFYTKNMFTSLLCGLTLVFLSIAVCYFVSKRYLRKQNITKELKNIAQNIYNKLPFCTTHKQTNWLKQCIYPQNNALVFEDFLYFNGYVIYNALLEKIDENKIPFIIRNIANNLKELAFESITILCDDQTKQATTFCSSLNIKIELLDKFKAIKKYNLNPNLLQSDIYIKKETKNFKFLINYALSPNRTKSYFTLGLILVFSSFFVLYKIYYLIFGSVLLIMCIITLFLHLKSKNKNIH